MLYFLPHLNPSRHSPPPLEGCPTHDPVAVPRDVLLRLLLALRGPRPLLHQLPPLGRPRPGPGAGTWVGWGGVSTQLCNYAIMQFALHRIFRVISAYFFHFCSPHNPLPWSPANINGQMKVKMKEASAKINSLIHNCYCATKGCILLFCVSLLLLLLFCCSTLFSVCIIFSFLFERAIQPACLIVVRI